MTVHAHQHPPGADAAPAAARLKGHNAAGQRTPVADIPAVRPGWFRPALAGGFVVLALVVTGTVPLSTVLYVGLFGGMILMHLGGHGSHGSEGSHKGQGAGTTSDSEGLSHRSHRSQPGRPASDGAPTGRASIHSNRNEPHDHDQPSSRGCH